MAGLLPVTVFKSREVLPSGTNLNTLKTNGIFYTGSGVVNAGWDAGILLVFAFSAFVVQFHFHYNNGDIKARSTIYGNGEWNTWAEWRLV